MDRIMVSSWAWHFAEKAMPRAPYPRRGAFDQSGGRFHQCLRHRRTGGRYRPMSTLRTKPAHALDGLLKYFCAMAVQTGVLIAICRFFPNLR
jgi:hypothetical protein